MDFAAVFGLILGISAVVGGQVLEGGHLGQIMAETAFIIVFGGTMGATLSAYPMQDIKKAIQLFPLIFKKRYSISNIGVVVASTFPKVQEFIS